MFLAVFVAWPLVRLVADSFFKISPIAGGPRDFVGFANYVRARSPPRHSGRRLADRRLHPDRRDARVRPRAWAWRCCSPASASGPQVFRTIFLYPLMIAPDRRRPAVAVPADRQLRHRRRPCCTRQGILSSPNQIRWLCDPDIVLFSVAIPDIWLTTSFMTLVLFAGLQNIPGDLIEAARLDGARHRRCCSASSSRCCAR